MKIGILTQPLHFNYGGVLQNWALQQTLMRMGHSAETIALQMPQNLSVRLILMRVLSLLKTIGLKCCLCGKERRIDNPFTRSYSVTGVRSCDDSFISRRIASTRSVYTHRALLSLITKRRYDAFIVGSDQVWREIYSPRIETFFLDFLREDDSRPKIAYAASFGVGANFISEEKLHLCIPLLRRFCAVSVREESALKILNDVFRRKDAALTLDPTLLLKAHDYRTLINAADRNNVAPEYVAAYILDRSDSKQAIVSDIASDLGKPVRSMSIGDASANMPTISQWLSIIQGADFVITDSFHGCVFSIIFHKPFIVIGNRQRGLDRFTSLLGALGLSGRLVLTPSDYYANKAVLISAIDYNSIGHKLESLRSSSLQFLSDALQKT